MSGSDAASGYGRSSKANRGLGDALNMEYLRSITE